jgi:hypothetical protein
VVEETILDTAEKHETETLKDTTEPESEQETRKFYTKTHSYTIKTFYNFLYQHFY